MQHLYGYGSRKHILDPAHPRNQHLPAGVGMSLCGRVLDREDLIAQTFGRRMPPTQAQAAMERLRAQPTCKACTRRGEAGNEEER